MKHPLEHRLDPEQTLEPSALRSPLDHAGCSTSTRVVTKNIVHYMVLGLQWFNSDCTGGMVGMLGMLSSNIIITITNILDALWKDVKYAFLSLHTTQCQLNIIVKICMNAIDINLQFWRVVKYIFGILHAHWNKSIPIH